MARSSASSKARRSSTRGTRRSASATRRAREESGELSQLLSPAPRLVTTIAKENQTYCSKLVRSSQGDADADREGGPS
jgi:hypothetical protein